MAKTITVTVTWAEEDYDDVHEDLMLSDFLELPNNFEVQLVPNAQLLSEDKK